MAFTESDRVQIRKYMGTGSIFLQLYPILENAISAVQALADGGSRPDNSTELEIRVQLANIVNIETKITCLYDQLEIITAGQEKVEINATRALYVLKNEGRRFIGNLSRLLACAPMFDYFSPQMSSTEYYPNIYNSGRRL